MNPDTWVRIPHLTLLNAFEKKEERMTDTFKKAIGRLDYMSFSKISNATTDYYIAKMNEYLQVQDIPVENVISIIERADEFLIFYRVDWE